MPFVLSSFQFLFTNWKNPPQNAAGAQTILEMHSQDPGQANHFGPLVQMQKSSKMVPEIILYFYNEIPFFEKKGQKLGNLGKTIKSKIWQDCQLKQTAKKV